MAMDLERLESFIVPSDATVLQAAEKIERNHSRAVVACDGERVVGVLSQGDITRLLLRGGSVHTVIDKILRHPFLFLRSMDFTEASILFRDQGVSLIPVLDPEGRLVELITLKQLLEKVITKGSVSV